MPRAVNFRRGVGTGPAKILGKFPFPDLSLANVLTSDFSEYTAADWVAVGTGTPTRALLDAVDLGVLRLGNSAASGDANGIRWAGGAGAARNTFSLTAGKKLGFKARLAVNNAASVTLNAGIADTSHQNAVTTGNAVAVQATASGWVLLVYTGGAAQTVVAVGPPPALGTSFAELSWVYDGAKISAYHNGNLFATCNVATLPTAVMAPFFSIRNGAASARNLDLDYFLVMKER